MICRLLSHSKVGTTARFPHLAYLANDPVKAAATAALTSPVLRSLTN